MKIPEFNSPCKYPTVFFGEYFIPNGGKPMDIFVRFPIEWLVVENDLENKKALLVSKYALDWEGFANCPLIGSGYETSWDASYSRIWLNGDFYNDSFSDWQKELIVPCYIEATGGNKERTFDKIFLLSVEEVEKYFPEKSSAVALEPMVESVTADGTEKQPIEIDCYPIPWWTRTAGETPDRVICVGKYGGLFDIDSNADEMGVRPAMWIKYDENN